MRTLVGLLQTLLTAVSVVSYSSQTTDERYEITNFYFHYDPYSRTIVGSNYHTCYIAPLTRQESDSMHSDRGMEDIEIAMMRDWIGVYPEIKIYQNDQGLTYNLQHWCNHRSIFYIQRPLGLTTTTPSTTLSSLSASVVKSSTVPVTLSHAPTTRVMTKTTTSSKQPVKTTTQIPISATSPHSSSQTVTTRSQHTDTSIFYIQSSPMKAVLVTSQLCYVYIMTDVESMVIKTGNDMQAILENTITTKDRTTTIPYTEQDPTTLQQIKQHCPGTVVQFI
ncbi:hypothetical protein ACF0H5_014558 [Mactra antiquata]